MSAPYIPAKESSFITWAMNFSTLITASPGTYGLQASDATAISNVNTPYQAAYLVAKNPTTRSPTTVATKNTARVNALAVMRPYAVLISRNAGVSPSNKVALGVNPQTSTPTPVPAPTTYPVLSVPSALTGGLVIRFRDELASPSVKAKPPGATYLLMRAITMASGTPSAAISTWPIVAVQTKSPFTLDTSSLTTGESIYMAGQWRTRKGLAGAFGPTVTSLVPMS